MHEHETPKDKVLREFDGRVIDCVFCYSPAEYMMPPTYLTKPLDDAIKSIPVCGLHAAAIRARKATE